MGKNEAIGGIIGVAIVPICCAVTYIPPDIMIKIEWYMFHYGAPVFFTVWCTLIGMGIGRAYHGRRE